MATIYTAENLILTMRAMGMIPDSGSTGSEAADLLRHINEAMRSHILPRIMQLREAYLLQKTRITLGSGNGYRVPSRAVYDKVQNVWWIDADGERIALAPVPAFDVTLWGLENHGDPAAYLIQGNYILLCPFDQPTFVGYLEVEFPFRPGDLVLSGSYVSVATVTPSTKTITYTGTAPTTWAAGSKLDIHSNVSGADIKQWDLTISTINTGTKTIVFNEAIDGSVFGTKLVAQGDYVADAESIVLPALPRDIHPLLARAGALHFAESIGDKVGAQLHGQILEHQFQSAIAAMENRIEHRPLRITGRRSFV